MYNVSEAYKKAIEKDFQEWKAEVRVRYANNEQAVFYDDKIKDGITIESQMMSGGANENVIDVGAVPTKTARLTLIDDGTDLHRYAGARVSIYIHLKLESGSYERIPMGAFFVDSNALSRVDNRISIVAHDGMLSFGYVIRDSQRTALKDNTATQAARLLAAYSACGFSQDLSQLPNGNIPLNFDSPQIETAWDGIMWIAQILGCFGRINRQNYLEFVPIMSKWEWLKDDHSLGTIIAVRDIDGDQRYDEIKFADDRIHIVGVSMEGADDKLVTRSSAELIDDANITIALEKNPLIEGSSKPLEDILDDILEQLSTAYFYAFRSVIKNDPSLDAGDVIRLRGGVINGTNKNNDLIGFITHSTWEYGGRQTITNVGQTTIVYRDIAETNTIEMNSASLGDDDDYIAAQADENRLFYVPPIPQSQKPGRKGVKIKTAIIVSQYTSEYLKYDYTVLPFETSPILYGGRPQNPVICQGLPNGMKTYSRIESYHYDSHGKLDRVMWGLYWEIGDGRKGSKLWSVSGDNINSEPDSGTVMLGTVKYNGTEEDPGYISAEAIFKFDYGAVLSSGSFSIQFASLAEAQYAVGITGDYYTKQKVNQTVTKVEKELTPGSVPVDSGEQNGDNI